ncbi:alcohol dehydrogenase catalytic domain-containing protein [Candidatus Bathyarchaeota archaeon]|nr:alcohol dehydrogenase catalytic domain-containing protein [Candidatus Bathyarchaeota archaeon]
MKVAMYYSQRDIRIEEMQAPQIGEDEVLVKMKTCGICGSDLMDWYLKTRAPLVLGHEPAGTIVEKGADVQGFEVGDRVFVHHHVACQECDHCMRGDYTLCSQFHETNIKPGGFAQYFKVPTPNLRLDTLKIPKTLSFEEATLIEPVGCCLRALRKCNIQKNSNVAVIGAGTTGLIHIALAKIHGASMVFSSDLIDYRLDAARRYGADVVVDVRKENLAEVIKSNTDGKGADIVMVTAPSLKAYEDGLKACRKGGTLCVFAPTGPSELLQISPKELFFSEIHIIPSYSTSHLETKAALELIELGKLDVKALITHRFKLEETAKAFETAHECKESLKVVVFDE